jgi:hypothetical protein
MGGAPLIKLDELTKPATVLIEKISDAVGGIFKPYQIVRVAKAEAEADRVRADSQIQITDLHRRAMHRFLVEEGRKQSNIEDITVRALPLLNPDSSPQNVRVDWITNFFDKSRIVSEGSMQQLWARILAGEANNPGGFSRRTVNLLSDLEKSDAELFTLVCRFGWTLQELFYPLVFEFKHEIFKRNGIIFYNLTQLDSLGLINFDSRGLFQLADQPRSLSLNYFGTSVQLDFGKDDGNQLFLGAVVLTQAGRELAGVCDLRPVDGFLDYAIAHWESRKLAPKIVELATQPT